MQRSITHIYQALPAHMEGLITYRALPTHELDYLDPFLFLNHHGPQQFPPDNKGLPFGPHPHRGFETLTFILQGDVVHRDSTGGQSIIRAGGIQWMTAGSGLVHAELSSEEFKEHGGTVEVLQLWLNLPARLKMTAPAYYGYQEPDIPVAEMDSGLVKVHAVSGVWHGAKGPVEAPTGIDMAWVEIKKNGEWKLNVEPGRSILCYVVKGDIFINNRTAGIHSLVGFGNEGDEIKVEAMEDAILIFGHGEPLNEPVVSHGPFVMNTRDEIIKAIEDYQTGKMGSFV